MLPAVPSVLAAIPLDFDPLVHLGELAVRWQTIGITLALLAALGLAALIASRWDAHPVRLSDMVMIVGGVVPGAVVGGRLVHAIVFWDAYASEPIWILDPSVGSLSLLGAVLGGSMTGAYVARLVGAPVPRWTDAAAVPILLAIGLGKFAQLLGGSGQGLPFDGPWAVEFGGAGPWISANPDMPSHPSQVYEGLWALLGIPMVVLWNAGRRAPAGLKDGRLFIGALSWFLIGRVLVGFTWRDDRIAGPFNAEQALALATLVAISLGVALWRPRYRGHMQTRAEERLP